MSQFPEIASNLSTANFRASMLTMLQNMTNGTYTQTVSVAGSDPQGVVQTNVAKRSRDVLGRQKVTVHQNVYEADFEYGKQPLRWDEFTTGGGTIAQLPGYGGVMMTLPTTSGAVTIRQSRPYHRYQPGKTMFMSTALNLGTTQANQVQRVGFFDDANGVFFQQYGAPTASNPYGLSVVYRSDVPASASYSATGSTANDIVVDYANWSDPQKIKSSINFANIQMYWIEYAWYGAGAVRWGVFLNAEPYILHEIGFGNNASTNLSTGTQTLLQTIAGTPQYDSAGATGQQWPWSRTGNLPVRYEQRNIGTTASSNNMFHYGVSVVVEGKRDEQRGFTYSYGMDPTTPRRNITTSKTRYPVLSVQARTMGTQEYTQATAACTAGTTTSLTAGTASWTVNQWKGRGVSYVVSGVTYTARITSNTTNVLTLADIVTGVALSVAPVAGQNYTIGQINRGQLLPQTLLVSSDNLCVVELIASTPTNPVVLTGANFTPLSSLGSANSFGTRDVSATALSGGEVVYAFTAPAGGSGLQTIDLTNFFPLYNTIKGNAPDILTVAVTTASSFPSGTSANVGAHIIVQEAMS
jgi:hypothetical protein